MRLKHLTLQGFKTYEQHGIVLSSIVTAIDSFQTLPDA